MKKKVALQGGITRILNAYTQGWVSDDTEGRISGILDVVAWRRGEISHSTQRDLSASRADPYPSGESVSIEEERARALRMQEGLDRAVTRENLFHDVPHKDGRPPCLRVGRERE